MKIFALALLLALTFSALAQGTDDIQIAYEEQVPDLPPNPIPQPVSEPQLPPIITQPQVQRQPFKLDIHTLKRYQYEVLAVSAIFFYIIIYLRGKRANVELMQRFYRKVAGYLQANFAHIGFTKVSGEAPFNGQSPSDSTFYASGRDNVEGIEIRFQTKKRHDLIYMLLDIFMPDRDTVTIDLPTNNQVPLVFAIAERKRIKDLTEKHVDIRMMTRQFAVKNFPQNYEVLGEAVDTVDSLVDNYVIKRLNEISGLVSSIHYTDLKVFSQNSGHLRVVLNLAHKKQQHFLAGLELALYLADKISGLKLSAPSKAKALKSREVYNQSKQKQDLQKHNEQLRKKKEQKLRQQEAWLRSLPPEKQKREEQKRKKKEFNKLLKGKTMKI